MEKENVKREELAVIGAVSLPSIYSYLAGNAEPKRPFISAVLDHFPHVNPLWLLSGRGDYLLADLVEAKAKKKLLYNEAMLKSRQTEIQQLKDRLAIKNGLIEQLRKS